MSPIIVLDENNNPYLTIGSPGGKLLFHMFLKFNRYFYKNTEIYKSIESPNYKNKWKYLL